MRPKWIEVDHNGQKTRSVPNVTEMYQIGPQCNEVDRTRLKRPNGPNWTELD